jgi:hypothetical protein
MDWATFWAIFSQTHLATLFQINIVVPNSNNVLPSKPVPVNVDEEGYFKPPRVEPSDTYQAGKTPRFQPKIRLNVFIIIYLLKRSTEVGIPGIKKNLSVAFSSM